MRGAELTVAVFLLAAFTVTGQAPSAQPRFERASIDRVHAFPEGCNLLPIIGGPGTTSPALLTIPAMRPIDLLGAAFGLEYKQILGLDRYGFAWNGTFIYKIVARVPRGSTKEQVGPMLQDTLFKRFHLTAHREARVRDLYDLTLGDQALKMTRSSRTGRRPQARSCIGTLDKNGFPRPCPGCSETASYGKDGIMFNGARDVEITDLAGLLADLLGRPVLNKTGLTGRYDFDFEYATDGLAGPEGMGPNAGPTVLVTATDAGASHLIAAVKTQLGLVLKANRASLDVLVVDHIDETPTGN